MTGIIIVQMHFPSNYVGSDTSMYINFYSFKILIIKINLTESICLIFISIKGVQETKILLNICPITRLINF